MPESYATTQADIPSGTAQSVPRQKTRRKRATSTPTTDPRLDDQLRSHKRMAKRFADLFVGKFMHTPGKGWLEFNGAYWEDCGESRPWRAVHVVCTEALKDLPDLDRDAQKDLWQDIRECDTAAGTAGVLKHARYWPGIGHRDEELDQHPGLFICRNGTYDLYRDEFRASDPADLMTLTAGVDYDPDAQCPTYDAQLAQYQPDPDVRAYLHRLGGAAMEGRQNLQQLIVHYGQTGGNGKGTIQRLWMHVFGDYVHLLPVEALLARRGYDQYRDEKAQLRGKRLVYVTEPSQGQRFDTGTVKSLTGGDPITARAVYKASITFYPTWLIMMATNNRVSTPNDGGMARRLKEIGWTYTIPRESMNDAVEDRMRSEASGILNRLLEGWRDYRAQGPAEPESVRQATAEYLASVDPVARFIEESVVPTEGVLTPSSSLYQAYSRWCADNGEHPMSARLFSPDMERRGYVKVRKGSGIWWQGVALVTKGNEW